jgi:hypothetical protein
LLLWDSVGVEHDSLDVSHICVVLESSTVESDVLAHLGNLLSIVLGEDIELENSLRNVWSTREIDLEDLGLQVPLIWSVLLQSLEKEGCALLDLVELQENVDNLINWSLWWSLIPVGDHPGETNSGLRVHSHDLSQNLYEIWDMTSLLAVRHDLVKLVGFDESLDDLIGGTRLLIDAESHLRIGLSDKISKLVCRGQLLLLDPVFDEVELILLNDRSCKLNGLNGVQLCGLEKGIEVDENRCRSSSRW